MSLPEKQFSELVNDQVAAMQAASNLLLDFDVGSILRALVESNAGNSLWLEALVTTLLAVTRLTTSKGQDVDTFVEQFGLSRLPATSAFGDVTFSRFTTTTQAIIPAGTFDLSVKGALVYSPVSQVNYSVYADTANPNYDANLNAYVLQIGISSITVPIIAVTPGQIGNVLANQINTIASILVGVDTVTNAQPLTNGEDQESDAALKNRFYLYISGLSKATREALAAAILGVQGVARYKLVENEDVNGNPYLGFFYAVVDDGTGNASGPLLANVQSVLDATRGFTIAFSDYAPVPFPISTASHVFTDGSIPDETVEAAVIAAQEKYITTQSFDALFPYTQLPRIIYDTNLTLSGQSYSPIINVNGCLLNGGTSDIQITGRQIMTVGTITVIMNA